MMTNDTNTSVFICFTLVGVLSRANRCPSSHLKPEMRGGFPSILHLFLTSPILICWYRVGAVSLIQAHA